SSLRWLISITDNPLPCQSSISAWARCSTAVGSAAGPAQKLWARFTCGSLGSAQPPARRRCVIRGYRLFLGDTALGIIIAFAIQQLVLIHARGLLHALQANQRFIAGQFDENHALGVATHYAQLVDTGTHQGALIGNQHDLLTVLHLDGA